MACWRISWKFTYPDLVSVKKWWWNLLLALAGSKNYVSRKGYMKPLAMRMHGKKEVIWLESSICLLSPDNTIIYRGHGHKKGETAKNDTEDRNEKQDLRADGTTWTQWPWVLQKISENLKKQRRNSLQSLNESGFQEILPFNLAMQYPTCVLVYFHDYSVAPWSITPTVESPGDKLIILPR